MARKKKPEFRLTEQQLAEASAYVQAAQHLLGLQGWRIEVSAEAAHKSNNAEIHLHDSDDLIGQVRFGSQPEPWSRERIAMLVVHELMHPFLHHLIQTATRGKPVDSETSAQEHRIINVLTPVLTEIVLEMVDFEDEGGADEAAIH